MINNIKTKLAAAILAGSLFAAAGASAAPMSGSSFVFFGTADATTTAVSFPTAQTVVGTGSFAPYVAFSSFASIPFTTGAQSVNLFTAEGYTFVLQSLSQATFGLGTFTLTGEGELVDGGTTISDVSFALNGTGGLNHVYTDTGSVTVPSSVPDGGTTAALLGAGILGLAFMKRVLGSVLA